MKSKKFLLLSAIALCTLASASVDSVKIAWAPKVGGVTKHRVDIAPDVPGMEIKIAIEVSGKCLKVENGEITMEESILSTKMSFNGQEMDPPAELGSQGKQVIVYAANGEVKKGPETQPMPRIDESNKFIFPTAELNVGDTWKRSGKGDEKKGTVDSTTTFTYEGAEKVGKWDCHKIRVAFRELVGQRPMANSGYVWVEVGTGELVKAEYTAVDVEFQPGMFANSKTVVTRLE
ncbi:MAG: hypothetical protein HZC36_12660 [Armatimonadetes bacterium]|nr:hypothetical protein [Armatimonadota bacterium]